jgi:hypothetical protein
VKVENVALTAVGAHVDNALSQELVMMWDFANVTVTASERNAVMMDATPETFVTFVDPTKFAELTFCVPEHVPRIVLTLMEQEDNAVTTDVLVHAENVLQSRDKTLDAEMVSVSVDLNAT